MDINPQIIDCGTKNSFVRDFKDRVLYGISRNTVDVVSCETKIAYDKLKASKFSRYGAYDKLVIMPNGFDEDLLKSYSISEKEFIEKDNIMITVGRLGTSPKNTGMLLKALSKVDLRDWKFYLIGPIDDSFKCKIDAFFEKYPEKRDNVVFTGPIYDKEKLWCYYNKSKVFTFTSEWESFGLVLVEAKRFRNYILTTPVGASYDVLENGRYGEIVMSNDDGMLANKIQDIIDGKIDIDVYGGFNPHSLSYDSVVNVIADNLNI